MLNTINITNVVTVCVTTIIGGFITYILLKHNSVDVSNTNTFNESFIKYNEARINYETDAIKKFLGPVESLYDEVLAGNISKEDLLSAYEHILHQFWTHYWTNHLEYIKPHYISCLECVKKDPNLDSLFHWFHLPHYNVILTRFENIGHVLNVNYDMLRSSMMTEIINEYK
uniref:Uncharacterized protein n=1 Tax=Dactylella tenuis TaxID=383872 RepID=A0A4Y5MXK6_9PEZI|nr:hypothetical protein [Dactylella tenuis]QCW06862.1 hypothetical protein [Dactylella tenuis]